MKIRGLYMKFSLEKTRAALWAYGMDCSTWFLVENQSKMTYPLPLGFQHARAYSVVFLRYDYGIVLAVRAVFMLKFQEHALVVGCRKQEKIWVELLFMISLFNSTINRCLLLS